jgi:hypothetical protein
MDSGVNNKQSGGSYGVFNRSVYMGSCIWFLIRSRFISLVIQTVRKGGFFVALNLEVFTKRIINGKLYNTETAD